VVPGIDSSGRLEPRGCKGHSDHGQEVDADMIVDSEICRHEFVLGYVHSWGR
jgi:hypothetical protein